MRARTASLVLLACAVSACSSTVQVGSELVGQPGTQLTNDNGLVVPTDGGSLAPGTDPGATSPTGGGQNVLQPDGSVTRPDGTVVVPAPSSGVSAPGITATTVSVGVGFVTDAGAGNAALGAANSDPGDDRDYYNAVIDDLNKRGGVLGRKMQPVYAQFAVASQKTFDQQHQEACDTWTKDNKVFAIFDIGAVANECARKAGAVITAAFTTGETYAKYPMILNPSGMRIERLGAATVSGVLAQGFMKPAPEWPFNKIGLITWDTPEYHYMMEHGYLAALRRASLKETDVRYVAVPQDANSISEASAAVSNAVLAFSTQNIDHVFISDGPAGVFTGTGLTFLFLRTAESQQYRPRYGFNEANSPGNTDLLPPEQQHGMLAVTGSDNSPENDEGIATNPQRERCHKVLADHDVLVAGDEIKQNKAAQVCDSIWFIETLLKRMSALSLNGAISAAEGLGTFYRPPGTYGARFSPGVHDASYLVRVARFDDDCVCMKYLSKPFEP